MNDKQNCLYLFIYFNSGVHTCIDLFTTHSAIAQQVLTTAGSIFHV